MTTNLEMPVYGLINPETQTPANVYWWLRFLGATVVVFATIVVFMLAILVGLVIDADLLSAGIVGAIIGALGGFYSLGHLVPYVTAEVPAYVGRILTNQWTKTQRVIFQGLNPILLWETPERDIDLQAEVKEVVGKEGNIETYPTKDGRITAKYTYTIGPNLWNKNGIDPGASVMQWASFKIDTIQTTGRARFSRALSDFVKIKSTEDVIQMGKTEINKAVFPQNAFIDFEKGCGGVCEVIVEDIDRDPALEEAREVIAKAESAKEAIALLIKKGENGEAGMDPDLAAEFVQYYSFPNVQKIKLDVTGLENLTHFSGIIPGVAPLGGKTDGDNKKKKRGKK
jgi:hypothetical protein